MPTDLAHYTSATATVILAVAITVSLAKPLLEAKLLPPTNSTHDTVIRLLAIAVGIAIIVVATIASLPGHNVLTPGLAFSAVVEGGKAGIFSVLAYHLLTASWFDGSQATAILGPAPTPASPSVTVVPPQKGDAVVVTPAAPSPASGAWGSPPDVPTPLTIAPITGGSVNTTTGPTMPNSTQAPPAQVTLTSPEPPLP